MSTEEKQSAFARVKKQKDKTAQSSQPRRFVNTGVRRNVTSNKVPLSMRLTESDDIDLASWLDDISHERGKTVTAAKLFRALIHMRDDINKKKLVNALKEVG